MKRWRTRAGRAPRRWLRALAVLALCGAAVVLLLCRSSRQKEPPETRIYGDAKVLREIPRRWGVKRISLAGDWAAWLEGRALNPGSMVIRCEYRLFRYNLKTDSLETACEVKARSGSRFLLNPNGDILLWLRRLGTYIVRPGSPPRLVKVPERLLWSALAFHADGLLHQKYGFIPYRDGRLFFDEAVPIPAADCLREGDRFAWVTGKQPTQTLVIHRLSDGSQERFDLPALERGSYHRPRAMRGRYVLLSDGWLLHIYDTRTRRVARDYVHAWSALHFSPRRLYVQGPGWPSWYLYAHDPATGKRRNLGIWFRGRHSGPGLSYLRHDFDGDHLLLIHERKIVFLDLEQRSQSFDESLVWDSPECRRKLAQARKELPDCLAARSTHDKRYEACKQLVTLWHECGPRAAPIYHRILTESTAADVQSWAADRLALIGDRASFDYLVQFIETTTNRQVRGACYSSLHQVKGRHVEEYLLKRLRADPSANWPVDPLGAVAGPEALAPLREKLSRTRRDRWQRRIKQAIERIEARLLAGRIFAGGSPE